MLRAALSQAEHWNLISRNPAAEKRVRTPRVTPHRPFEFTPATAQGVVAAFRAHPLEALVLTAILTGMREGELLGLRWQDVDLDAAVLHVRHQLQRSGGARVLTPPKSELGVRDLPVPPLLIEALRAHRDRQAQLREAAGARWQDSGHVFSSTVGTPLEASNTLHRFQRQLVAAGLPKLRIHVVPTRVGVNRGRAAGSAV